MNCFHNKDRGPAVVWSCISLAVMLLIFWFSSRNGVQSAAQSSFLATLLARWTDPETATWLVRKTAHFCIYLILGFCVLRAMYFWHVPRRRLFLAAWILCILYAGSDEFHQLFSAGRSGQFSDVFLDSMGSLMGCTISLLIIKCNYDII